MSTYTGIIRSEWSGTSGGPGLTQIAVETGDILIINAGQTQTLVNAMRTFWDSIKAYLPDEVVISVNPTIDLYNTASGQLVGSSTAASSPAGVAGTATGVYAGGAGMRINWATGVIRNGRRVRGSTYIVPAASTVYTNNGTVSSSVRTPVGVSATTLISALEGAGFPMQVFSRPSDKVPGRPGAVAKVESGTVNAKTAVLRGRRD